MFFILIKGMNAGAVFPLKKDGFTTGGRGKECDIQVLDLKVSRYHFQVEEKDGSFCIKDLGSTNKTYVNKNLAKDSQKLEIGDTVEIGDTIFLFTDQKQMPINSVEDFNRIKVNQTMRIDLPK